MSTLFLKDDIAGIEISYDELLWDLATTTSYCRVCKSTSYYSIFKQIIFSLIIGEEIILLDADFSESEVKNLLGENYIEAFSIKNVSKIGQMDFGDILRLINEKKNSWKVTLFTSGTTGLPKKISHTFDSISRSAIIDVKRSNNIWGFAYNPTHMAGLQVFFQAFLNTNPIIRLFGLDRIHIMELINKYKVTNISATPTFYRLLLPADQICSSVSVLTSGGEKFDSNTLNTLQKMFPNCKIRNIYASTEAGSLFSSSGDSFSLKPEMSHLIKVVNNEILLHSSLLGESSGIEFINDWYATGDLIEILEENPLIFKFTSRKNEMINTGGYKVNPTEVEETIRLCHGIMDVFVYGKKSSLLGNVVCCDVVKSDILLTEKIIRDFLKDKLQEYKIPRIVKFVDTLTRTKTGKLSRK